MVVRFRSFAAIVIAASPLAAAHAELLLPAIHPSFNCDAASGGGTINWGDISTGDPSIGFGADSSNVSFTPMSCALVGDNKVDTFTQSLLKFDDNNIQQKYFELKISDGDNESLGVGGVNIKFLKISDPNGDLLKLKDANGASIAGEELLWDLTVKLNKLDEAGGVVGSQNEFIGLKITAPLDSLSTDKDPDPTESISFNFGSVKLDPSIVGSITSTNANISLYSTPMATPEPGTLVLLGTGLLGLGAAFRRRLGW